MYKINNYQVIWNTETHQGSIHLHFENGKHHHISLASANEGDFLMKLLHSGEDVFFDPTHNLLLSGFDKDAGSADELTKIEGIGPKIEEALHNAGIHTFGILSHVTPDELMEVLLSSEGHFEHVNPESWPIQARMAAHGDWDDLKEFQDMLHAGQF